MRRWTEVRSLEETEAHRGAYVVQQKSATKAAQRKKTERKKQTKKREANMQMWRAEEAWLARLLI